MSTETLRILLLALLATPLSGAVIVALLGHSRIHEIRWVSVAAALATLLLAAIVTTEFAIHRQQQGPLPPGGHNFAPDMVTKVDLLPVPGSFENEERTIPSAIRFHIGLDGLNVWMVLLTAVLMLPSVLVSWHAITERVNEFYAWLLALQTAMMGIFLSFDIICFYVFFEVSLVPLFFLIGIWGGPQRQHAAKKFFIYTLTGSLITLLGVLGIVVACQDRSGLLTFSIPQLVEIVHEHLRRPEEADYWRMVQLPVFLALMAGFAIKVPLVPFHTWLPLAHVEAPTAGSVDLAGVLLKIGVYGFLRLCMPLAPDTSLALGIPLISGLAVIGVVYGAFCAYAQTDIKRLIAYSSVSHLGLCMVGIFALNPPGLAGGLMQMINHGLATGALFLLIGMLYERYHTRKLSDYGGMAARLPRLGCFMVFICLASVGMPGLNGFVGEVLVLMGAYAQEWGDGWSLLYAVVASSGIILGAWYLFTLLRHVFFGPLKEPHVASPEGHHAVTDLTFREVALIAPLALLCLVIGVYPQPILDASQRDLDVIANIARDARERRASAVAAHPTVAEKAPSGEAP